MHPLLAEYHRTLITDAENRVLSRTALPDDTGGYLRINVYQLSQDALLLRDFSDSYAIDLTTGSVLKDAHRRRDGIFLGAFDEDVSGTFRFITAAERGEQAVGAAR